MKKIIAVALAAVMLLCMLAGCAGSGSGNKLNTIEKGKLTMSTNASFPPYEMTTDEGGFTGIDVDIATEIAKKLGLELEILDMDFDAALLAVNQRKSDIVMAGVTVNEDRKLVMDFTDSYATGVQVVIVPDDSSIATLEDLEGKKIGTQRGTTGYIYTSDEFGEDAVIAYDNGASAIKALMNNQVDCVVIDNAPAKEYVKANPGLKILETEYAVEDYAIGCDKGNTELVNAINKAMKELKDDGTIQKIIDKYISSN